MNSTKWGYTNFWDLNSWGINYSNFREKEI